MNVLLKIKNIKLRYIHIVLIFLGTIFISLSAFHINLWFDEAYSVGMANLGFKDIWLTGSKDVHPVLYYFLLHILNLLFGSNIIIYRLFSVLCTTILGIIGFTHIRKDFGEKTGLLFSFLVFFFPVSLVYSGEIRMYSLAMLLVTLTAIYAYRIYINVKENFSIKNWIIFVVFSLCSAYTHYYALMASGLINLSLMISLIIHCVKNREFNSNMKAFIISGITQIILYIPWVLILLSQVNKVSQGFWIKLTFPDTLIELFTFQFTGNLLTTTYVNPTLAIIWGLFVTIYMAILYLKDLKLKNDENLKLKVNMKPGVLSLILFLAIALSAYIVSLVIGKPIIYVFLKSYNCKERI